jgi:hypothetical protein
MARGVSQADASTFSAARTASMSAKKFGSDQP